MTLRAEERRVLDFERTWWMLPEVTTKRAAIQQHLAMSATRYYAILDLLVDSSDAATYDPLVVRRIRRRRLAQRRSAFIGEAPRRSRPH